MKDFDNALKLLPKQFVAYFGFFVSGIAKMYFPGKKNHFRYIFLTSIIFFTCNSPHNSTQFISSMCPLFIYIS